MAKGGEITEQEAKEKLVKLRNEEQLNFSIGNHGLIFMSLKNGNKKSYDNYKKAYEHYLNSKGSMMAEGGETQVFEKFMKSQIDYIISLKLITQKKKVINTLLSNMNDYVGDDIQKKITTDNLKYALTQKTASAINNVLKISLNALKSGEQMAKGGRLSRKQKQLDLNKNGKLDAQDFKMLRDGRKNARKK
jgi:hypothetical protein